MIEDSISVNIAGGLDIQLPNMVPVEVTFESSVLEDIGQSISEQFKNDQIRNKIKPGQTIAVGCGSRGVADVAEVAKATVSEIKALGGEPFIFPAMASHGAAIALLIGVFVYTRIYPVTFYQVGDALAIPVSIATSFVRLGNFFNSEIVGRKTSVPWAVKFIRFAEPDGGPPAFRHPSQLYEAFFEGIFLFVVLWCLRKAPFPRGTLLALYLIGYGLVRFCIEFFRQPDDHLGFIFLSFSMGQVLCGIMIGCGVFLFYYLKKSKTL